MLLCLIIVIKLHCALHYVISNHYKYSHIFVVTLLSSNTFQLQLKLVAVVIIRSCQNLVTGTKPMTKFQTSCGHRFHVRCFLQVPNRLQSMDFSTGEFSPEPLEKNSLKNHLE